jgi:alkylhydroperoxidase family enzyme
VPPPFVRLQAVTRRAVLDGPGSTDSELRRQVAAGQPPSELAALVQKIFDHAYRVTDDDVEKLRRHYTEEQLFELMIAAAVGASEYRLEAALAALEQACG